MSVYLFYKAIFLCFCVCFYAFATVFVLLSRMLLSVTLVDQSKTVQARITKFLPLAKFWKWSHWARVLN